MLGAACRLQDLARRAGVGMPSEGSDARQSLLSATTEPIKAAEGKLDQATDSIRSRIDKLSKRVQSRRDDPTTLLGCAVLFGILSGLVAYVYSIYFEGMLWVIWEVCDACLHCIG